MTNTASAYGFTTQISPAATYEQDSKEPLSVPASAQIRYEEGDDNLSLMVGRSPVDNKMVVHIDTAEGIPLDRLYINDGLAYGTGKEGEKPATFELPKDFGGSQRFLLAERLYRQVNPEPAPSLFDAPANVQQDWFRVADEAVAALREESSV